MQNDLIKTAQQAGEELTRAMEKILNQFKGNGDGPDLPSLLSEMALYAWRGELAGSVDHWLLQRQCELSTPDELLDGRFIDAPGEPQFSEENRAFIKKLVNAVHARRSIDEGESVTTEGLAALANVSERTIRAATNANAPNPVPIVKQGHWTYIEAEHARAWLSRRSDFFPTRSVLEKPTPRAISPLYSVGTLWKGWREYQQVEIDQLATQLAWSPTQTATYAAIEAGDTAGGLELPPSFWSRLAAHLGADEPEAVAAQTYRVLALDHAESRIRAELPPAR